MGGHLEHCTYSQAGCLVAIQIDSVRGCIWSQSAMWKLLHKGTDFFSYSQLLHVGYKHDKVLKSVTYCSLLVAQYVENKLEYMTLQINCPHTFMKSKFIRRTSVASIYFETTIRLSFIFQFLVAMSNTSWHIFKLKPKFSHLTTPDINVNSCHRSTVFGNWNVVN